LRTHEEPAADIDRGILHPLGQAFGEPLQPGLGTHRHHGAVMAHGAQHGPGHPFGRPAEAAVEIDLDFALGAVGFAHVHARLGHDAGVDHTRTDGGDPDAVPPHLGAQRLAQAHHRELGGAAGAHVGQGAQARGTGRVQ